MFKFDDESKIKNEICKSYEKTKDEEEIDLNQMIQSTLNKNLIDFDDINNIFDNHLTFQYGVPEKEKKEITAFWELESKEDPVFSDKIKENNIPVKKKIDRNNIKNVFVTTDKEIIRTRKFKSDDQRKKLKSNEFKSFKDLINLNLMNTLNIHFRNKEKSSKININYNYFNIRKRNNKIISNKRISNKTIIKNIQFRGISQEYICSVSLSSNKPYLNYTYRQLLETNSFISDFKKKDILNKKYKKKDKLFEDYQHNLKVLNFLDSNPLIRKESGFDDISELTFAELFTRYKESEDYKNLIKKLSKKNTKSYMKEMEKTAENYISFYIGRKRKNDSFFN